jgi:hypothetical protein
MCLAFNAGQSQIITPVDSRQSMLDGMNRTLHNVHAEAGNYGDVQSPFLLKVKEPEVVAQVKDLDNVPVVSNTAVVLEDSVALRIISQRFKPFGSLVMGDRGVLQLSSGQTIGEGESFKAEIQGVVYEVTIADVTSQSYKLALGSAEVEKTFLTTTGSNQ